MQLVQLLGLAAPARIPYVPARQRTHDDEVAAPTVVLNVPGAQGKQDEGDCAYVPAGQFVAARKHAEAPDALYVFSAHAAHGATPLTPNVPGRHPRVSTKPMDPPV